MMRYIAGCFTLLLWLISSPAKASPCNQGTAIIDVGKQTVTWTVRFPAGDRVLKLSDESSGSPFGWQVEGGGAQLTGNTLTRATGAATAIVTLSASLKAGSARQDRTYAPVILFKDGALAILSTVFNLIDERGQAHCSRLATRRGDKLGFDEIWGASEISVNTDTVGYVVVGDPSVEQKGGVRLVEDKETPLWVRARAGRTLAAVTDFYASRMGRRRIPPVVIYRGDGGERTYHWGDRLPSSITLGLFGPGWETETEALDEELDGFIAHEIFHIWNSSVSFEQQGDSLLAIEGGAELSRVLVGAEAAKDPMESVVSQVTGALNRCQFQLAFGSSIHELLKSQQPGRVPYDCGMVVMFASLPPGNAVAKLSAGFYGSWKTMLLDRSGAVHRWSELVSGPGRDKKTRSLELAISDNGVLLQHIEEALKEDGLGLEEEATVSLADRKQMATVLMAQLMQMDCSGAASFWPVEGGFQIDGQIKTCRTLRPGTTVVSIMGDQPWHDPAQLSKQISLRCERHQSIDIAYLNGTSATSMPCTGTPPHAPVPMKILLQ